MLGEALSADLSATFNSLENDASVKSIVLMSGKVSSNVSILLSEIQFILF